MNNEIYHELVNKYYTQPVFKSWTPDEYDMKYRYNTPRKLKKLEADKAKEDAKLKVVYDKQLAQYTAVHDIIDIIGTYPAEIAELFLNTFKWTIENIIRRHEAYLECCNKLTETYGKERAGYFSNLQYLLEKNVSRSSWSRRISHETIFLHNIPEDEWNTWTNSNMSPYRKMFKDITDTAKLCADYKQWKTLRDNDDICAAGTEAYPNAIRHMADVLKRICEEINDIFNGKPTECITEPHWGIDGKFNGILTDGTVKASFKSFGAGGYAIQRFHYRFKITKLKN